MQLEAEDALEQLEDVQEVYPEKQLEVYLLLPMVLLLPLPSTTIFHLEDQTLLMRMLRAKTTLILGKGTVSVILNALPAKMTMPDSQRNQ